MSKINVNFPSSLQEPRVPLATGKGVGPISVKQMVLIPETKINAIIQKVEDALQHTKITLKQMQS